MQTLQIEGPAFYHSFLHDSTSELPVRAQQTLIIICVHGILHIYHMVGISFSWNITLEFLGKYTMSLFEL